MGKREKHKGEKHKGRQQKAKVDKKRRAWHPEQLQNGVLQKWLLSNGLICVNIVPDGNCLFRSFSDQLYGHQDEHARLRHLVVDYIQKKQEEFAVFMDEDDGDFAHYCSRMRKETAWGGQLEIQAFSLMMGVNVLIHQSTLLALEFLNWPLHFPCIQLMYEEGEHYNSVLVSPSLMDALLNHRKPNYQWLSKESFQFRENQDWVGYFYKLMTAEEIRKISSWNNARKDETSQPQKSTDQIPDLPLPTSEQEARLEDEASPLFESAASHVAQSGNGTSETGDGTPETGELTYETPSLGSGDRPNVTGAAEVVNDNLREQHAPTRRIPTFSETARDETQLGETPRNEIARDETLQNEIVRDELKEDGGRMGSSTCATTKNSPSVQAETTGGSGDSREVFEETRPKTTDTGSNSKALVQETLPRRHKRKEPKLTKKERKRLEKARQAASKRSTEIDSLVDSLPVAGLVDDKKAKAPDIRPLLLQC